MNTGFRSDINGLRAWAVMAVVLYHFAVPGLVGGFAGVDVFFVISGFLMTSLVFVGLENRRFSLWRFYLARARRIFPALLVVCLVVLAVGWCVLMLDEYQQLGRHVRDSLLFISNIRYFKESGYFDAASHEKWLLHTWSLSVEWQFYMVLPVLLLLVWKLFPGRRAAFIALATLFVASWLVCLVWTLNEPDRAFYQLQARAWEMAAGGLLFFLAQRFRPRAAVAKAAEWSGFAMIVATFLLVDAQALWPGWLALLPVGGTCLVLLAGRERSWLSGTALTQWLGSRSYSIYLWHWPRVVGLAYMGLLEQPQWLVAGVLLSVLLGHLSYVLIEEPVRKGGRVWAPRWEVLVLCCSLLLVATMGQLVRKTGVPERLSAAVIELEAQRQNRNPRQKECLDTGEPCRYGGERIRLLLLGDSHADTLVTAIVDSLPTAQDGLFFRGLPGCLMLIGAKDIDPERTGCLQLNQWMVAEQESLYPGVPMLRVERTSFHVWGGLDPDEEQPLGTPGVYFSQKYDETTAEFLQEFRQEYVATACRLTAIRPLYLMRPIPEMGINVPLAMGRALLLGKSREPSISLEAYHQRNAFVWSVQDQAREQCGAQILDPLPYLCDARRCYGSRDGKPLYYDDDHLSEYGNRLLLPLFKTLFD
jgi:peptidoglycan/LPS O-acetylase OafA/YrhL